MLTQIINAKILTPQGWLKDGSVLKTADAASDRQQKRD